LIQLPKKGAWKKLKLKRESTSVITMQNSPCKKKLSDILNEIGRDDELADRIETASREMRQSKMRNANL